MRAETESGNWFWQRLPGHVLVCIMLVVIFVADVLCSFYFRQFYSAYHQWLDLSPQVLSRGKVWQLLTFQFFHAGLFHIFFNALSIYMFGAFVEDRLGKATFWRLFLGGGVAGGFLQGLLAWLVPKYFGFSTVGASAGCFSLVAAFALIDPDADIRIYGILPIKAKHLLIGETAIAVLFTLAPVDRSVAYAAHLGGIIFAWYYMRLDTSSWVYKMRRRLFSRKPLSKPRPAPTRLEAVKVASSAPSKPAKDGTGEFISNEVDPILDKISAHGIQSLTDKEREVLQAARKKMSKR